MQTTDWMPAPRFGAEILSSARMAWVRLLAAQNCFYPIYKTHARTQESGLIFQKIGSRLEIQFLLHKHLETHVSSSSFYHKHLKAIPCPKTKDKNSMLFFFGAYEFFPWYVIAGIHATANTRSSSLVPLPLSSPSPFLPPPHVFISTGGIREATAPRQHNRVKLKNHK